MPRCKSGHFTIVVGQRVLQRASVEAGPKAKTSSRRGGADGPCSSTRGPWCTRPFITLVPYFRTCWFFTWIAKLELDAGPRCLLRTTEITSQKDPEALRWKAPDDPHGRPDELFFLHESKAATCRTLTIAARLRYLAGCTAEAQVKGDGHWRARLCARGLGGR